ncbi:MAG TPA: hypothetical protein VF083_01315 [Acidimicrobiia bacterium]
MVIPRRRLILLALASTAALLVGAGPAAAVDTAEHGAEEIASIVREGQDDMSGVASALQSQIAGLSDQAAVGQAENEALASVESIWAAARNAVDEIIKLYPGELGQTGGEAKQQLQDARQAVRSTISDLVAGWAPPAPTTTTPPPTTSSSTTTTTTTTTPQPGGAAPGPDSGGGPGSNRNDSPEDQGGTRPAPPRNPQPSGSSNDESRALDVPGSSMVLELAASTPAQPFTVSSEAISGLLAAQDTSATAAMAAMLDTVLSPAVVDLVLSPLLILEILLRTLVDGGSNLIGPLTMFALAAMALFAYDRFAKRHLSLDLA